MREDRRDGPAWLQCDGKERYATPQLAAAVARRRMASFRYRHKAPKTPLNAYRCPHCQAFHLGRGG